MAAQLHATRVYSGAHGMSVSIGAVRYRFPNGSAFEGVGIAPDIPVDRRIADIAVNRDPALDRALEVAGAK